MLKTCLLTALFILIFISCRKDISPPIINGTDTTTVYGKWQWEYDIHDIYNGINYITAPSATTQLILTVNYNKTYSVLLNNDTVTAGMHLDSLYNYSTEKIIVFENPFNINSINFVMKNNSQVMNRVNAARLFMYDYEFSPSFDSMLTHIFISVK